jgi:L-malate glycosyltransferase
VTVHRPTRVETPLTHESGCAPRDSWLRLLHIDTERGWRGGQRQAFWLARELGGRGHDCIMAAREGEPLASRAAEVGLRVVACNPLSDVDFAAAWALRRLLRQERVHVVHAHTAHAIALGALATLGTGVPLVASRRVDFPVRRNVGTRWKYGRPSAIIAVSRAVARVLEHCGIDAARIAVIPDGTDVHRVVTPAHDCTLRSLGVVAGGPLVVQVAQLVPHKDPLNFVAAIEQARRSLPAVQGLLVGDGPLRPCVESAIAARGLCDAIHLAGYRTDADELLAAADVVCLSSREEGMGSVLLDAMMFGRPITATRAGGIPEIVRDGETGLLADIGDPAALGDAIVRLMSDSMLRERLVTNALRQVSEFSVEKLADRTLEVYARVFAPAPPLITSATSAAESRCRRG